eukprot:TRINITY_DN38446_c0_g1_i1.p1 TRINITY_DN38446_c0_g1~~TRINITY_DN38446_c0_g1_i1.p1  ORF type:complete len:600 (-),score=212.27 TRINITY_DN38446_c0_g1_i1:128-1927(-)
MEYRRPPRPRAASRSSLPPQNQAGGYDPVGLVANIWAGRENGQGLPPPRRSVRRSSSAEPSLSRDAEGERPDADELQSLRASLEAREKELESWRRKAEGLAQQLAKMEVDAHAQDDVTAEQTAAQGQHQEALARLRLELEEATVESRVQLSQSHEAAMSKLEERLRLEQEERECLLQGEVKQKQEWLLAEESSCASWKDEVQEMREGAKSELQSLESAADETRRKLAEEHSTGEQALKEELQTARRQMQEQKEEMQQYVDDCRRLEERATQLLEAEEALAKSSSDAEANANGAFTAELAEMRSQLERQLKEEAAAQMALQEQRLEENAISHLMQQELQAEVTQQAEELVHNLERCEAQRDLEAREEIAALKARCQAEERIARQMDEQVAEMQASLLNLEQHTEEEQRDARNSKQQQKQRDEDEKKQFETLWREQCSLELQQDREAQIAKLQEQMDQKLAVGLAEQQEKFQSELRKHEADVSKRAPGFKPRGGGDSSVDLSPLLEAAHEENCDLRRQLQELELRLATKEEEIEMLEGNVLGSLSKLRDDGLGLGRRSARSSQQAGAASRESTSVPPPGRSKPGDIRRLPPQPRQLSSQVQ